MSQSLWNRAMSYDIAQLCNGSDESVSIPLEQGNVLRLRMGFSATCTKVSIPLEQGNVLRLLYLVALILSVTSQSLWNRAMSYDLVLTVY